MWQGTYIRSIARDFGQLLELSGYLKSLCRTAMGNHNLSDSITIETFEKTSMRHHEKNRCPWCDGNPDYKIYHDAEWGVPIYDDDKLLKLSFLRLFKQASTGLQYFVKIFKAFDNFDAQRSRAMTRE